MIISMFKIMIAEDDPEIRKLFKKILIENGYETVEAIDGEEALSIYDALEVKPNLIILDYRMPRFNGIEVIKEILQRNPTISILMISGDPQIDHAFIADQGIKFKSKPVRMDEFLSEIRNFAQV
ncbi:hypothetical protein DRO91_04800 [Candidatus Heimdallarchaeota archaeon]|nr:MAG: hypothetical protein DRO63_01325 [Candidatus Gerdarchaeota archaeon]RLI71996.1 MAG: hypothetical protein DRP02_03215 [Candidatus Gerdarchaeota archaeon]RLI72160.1 MAG: hypothetical protein DRO91_04800 [Candidatus Heimdallarchaeota archaeon]